jgi:hypothetical protein
MLKVQGGAVHGWRLRSAASAILDAERLRLSRRRGWQHMYQLLVVVLSVLWDGAMGAEQTEPRAGASMQVFRGDMYVVVTVCGAKRAEGLIDSYVSRQDE